MRLSPFVRIIGCAQVVAYHLIAMDAMIESEPGYLLIAFGDYTVESSLWVGLLLIAVLVLVLYAVVGTIARLLASPPSVFSPAHAFCARHTRRIGKKGCAPGLWCVCPPCAGRVCLRPLSVSSSFDDFLLKRKTRERRCTLN